MRIYGLFFVVIGILSYIEKKKDVEMGYPSYFFLPPYVVYPLVCLIIGTLYFLLSCFLFRNKKWAWIGSIIFLFISGVIGTIGFYFIFVTFLWTMGSLNFMGAIFFLLILIFALFPLIALIYLLIDRKNYWKNV